jgi:rhamnulokinase
VPSAPPSYLAVDLGATSGRAVLGTLRPGPDGVRVALREVHRFATPAAVEHGRLAWDHERLWAEVREALARALALAPALRAVSVDSWALDYVPLDGDGRPLRRPYAYRDPRTHGRLAHIVGRVGGADALYGRTGTQFLDINTLPQIAADVEDEPALVARTRTRLFVADYLLYRLSGVAVAERTLASCSQLLDAATGDWAADVIRAVGDDPARWPPVVPPGTVLGPVGADALPAGFTPPHGRLPLVVAGCSHDTAAAVAAVPADDAAPWAFVSSGTWFLVGAERPRPLLTPGARQAGFTNEAGFGGTVRLLKNRTGFWVLEECRRAWAAAGAHPAYDALVAAAAACPPPAGVLDLDTPAFGAPGDMPARVDAACRAAGLVPPATPAACTRLIVESLAAATARALAELEALTGERAAVVHLVGGGARNALLAQRLADACGRPVAAGPDEAAALGNVLAQARATGDLGDDDGAVRAAARRSATVREFRPAGPAAAEPPGPAVGAPSGPVPAVPASVPAAARAAR